MMSVGIRPGSPFRLMSCHHTHKRKGPQSITKRRRLSAGSLWSVHRDGPRGRSPARTLGWIPSLRSGRPPARCQLDAPWATVRETRPGPREASTSLLHGRSAAATGPAAPASFLSSARGRAGLRTSRPGGGPLRSLTLGPAPRLTLVADRRTASHLIIGDLASARRDPAELNYQESGPDFENSGHEIEYSTVGRS